MQEPGDAASLPSRWIEKAETDLTAAVRLLKEPEGCPTPVVCFCAQQCVEKYMKAVLVANGIGFPKTHEIGELMRLLPPETRPDLSPAEQETLTDYAVVGRYAFDREPVSLSEARRAVRLARRVRAVMRRHLPKSSRRGT